MSECNCTTYCKTVVEGYAVGQCKNIRSKPVTDPLLQLGDRINALEQCVYLLARAVLSHEYAKDLNRYGIEEALKQLANYENITAAIEALRE